MSATANLDQRADIVGAAAVWAFSLLGLVLKWARNTRLHAVDHGASDAPIARLPPRKASLGVFASKSADITSQRPCPTTTSPAAP